MTRFPFDTLRIGSPSWKIKVVKKVICVPWQVAFPYAVAPKDYRDDSLTLYQFDYFQGQEEYTLTEIPNLNLIGNHQSIIITGNSDWTVYDRPQYQGNTVCLKVPEPGNSTPSFISDLQNVDPSIPHGSIRSVRKGCSQKYSNGTVILSSFARMETAFKPPQLV